MIRKTISITSLAILVATISVAATMTMVQADLTGDEVNIAITPAATPTDVDAVVGGAVEYDGDLDGVNALVTYTDSTDDDVITDTGELTIDNPGVNVSSGDTFTFTSSGITDAVVTFTDGAGSGTVDGTIDHIDELAVTEGGTTVVTEGQESITGADSELTVNIDPTTDTVWILLPEGPGTINDIVVTIDGMEWDTEGALGAVTCGTSTDTTTVALFDRDTLEFTLSSHTGLDTPIAVHCEFDAFHGDVDKTLDAPCEVQIMDQNTAPCSFTITYSGVRANVIDTVPAEWEVDSITNNGGQVDALVTYTDSTDDDVITDTGELTIDNAGVNVPNGVFTFTSSGITDAVVTFTDANADKKVQIGELVVTEGGTTVVTEGQQSLTADSFTDCTDTVRGNSGKSATKIICEDVTDVNSTVEIETRHTPGKGHKDANRQKVDVFKPTFCGEFPVNDGAQAILVNGTGHVVFSTLGIPIPIVLDFTFPLNATSVDSGSGIFDCDGELKP